MIESMHSFDRQENGTLSVARTDNGRIRLTGVYCHAGLLFVIDHEVSSGEAILMEGK